VQYAGYNILTAIMIGWPARRMYFAVILLMDEPFGSLDEQTRIRLDHELLDIWEKNKKTVIFITHCIEEAIKLADRIILLSSRPGKIQKEFLIQMPRPREAFGKELIEIHKEILCNFMLCCPECFSGG
jgi:ABC-type nitrate/sulfonate/bicarbonate transport system ATPase subunit